MKLYTNNKGDWVTSRVSANKAFGKSSVKEVDIPRSRTDLVSFLNESKFSPNPKIERPKLNTEDTQELLSSHASSWVNWALATLNRGDIKEAKAMLEKGLDIEFKLKKAKS
tara:strand:+ start:190 stop:522 length:333 start_codon:yes stop_codon:yes gene_type:complete